MNVQEFLMQTPSYEHWKRVGIKHHHGISLPLFSLRTEKSCGIGEFLDLLPLMHWCKSVGFDLIQLLPLNDTGLGTSPYDCISACALNPLFLSLHALPDVDKIYDATNKLQKIAYWSTTSRVKHHIVRELKNVFLKEYIPLMTPKIIENEEYQQFVHKELDWLEPFALFKSLKENQYWQHWEEWRPELKNPTPSEYQALLTKFAPQIQYHKVIQYLCFQQWKKVREEALSLGILLKGDVPILISKDSVDVWHYRNLFLLHLAAGAPPDMYCRRGQLWGFPLYDWPVLEQTDYYWWRRRLEVASQLFDLYRIDHVVGFFRIWAMESGQTAAEGRFYPSEEPIWTEQGKKLMKMMLQSCPMLPIGEDLGTVPPEVKKCLKEMGICGTKIMRWERNYEGDGSFIPVQDYDPISMTSVSTHDSDTLQLWWKHFPKDAKRFAEEKGWLWRPFLSQEHQKEILHASHHSASLFHVNLLQEYLALFPDLISKDLHLERINIPGKILDSNWTYRYIPSVEEMENHEGLSSLMEEIIC